MNDVAVSAPPSQRRADRLSAGTDDLHEHLHGVVAAAEPFSNRERFGTWVSVQYRFQHAIEPLYHMAALQNWLPDLANRGRLSAARQDLVDLGVDVPTLPAADPVRDLPEALGWLFVSEGSTLGAAVLLKKAKAQLDLTETFGARHLAAAPEGRAQHWKRFVQALDDLELSPEDDARMLAAARAAFQQFDVLLNEAFELTPA